jgi:hypothetical protein
MMIVLLAPPNVEGYYTASLLVRGFKAVTIPAVAPVLDFPKLLQEASQFGATLLRSQGLLAEMPNDGSHEETDDPLHADRRNFYKVEEWSRGRAANWGVAGVANGLKSPPHLGGSSPPANLNKHRRMVGDGEGSCREVIG